MKNLLYIFLLLPVLALGQTTSQNYVKTIVHKDSANVNDVDVNVTYFDGLGRPIQQIAGKQSATGKDIVIHMEYDSFGRQAKNYLPYAATTDSQAFDGSAQTNTVAFYNTSAFENTTNPYTEQFFEASPLNRVLKQGAPGTPWLGNPIQGNSNDYTDHTVKFAYITNTSADAVKKLSATASWNITTEVYDISINDNSNSTYAAGLLYKTITQDENKTAAVYTGSLVSNKLNTTEEFKNKEGQVILKRTFNVEDIDGTPIYTTLDTYYVYDQFGNLTYVLPPLAYGSISQLDGLCYQYKYDYRNRMVEKKLPGKQWEFLVHDKLDRVVASGPALSPWGGIATGWNITKYDAFGRVAYTGWYAAGSFNSSTRKTFQANTFSTVSKTTSATTIDNIQVYYTNSFPTTMKVLSINYYDNYVYANAPTLPANVELQPILSNVKGLATGSWLRALTSTSATAGETSFTLYDKKGRAIRTKTINYLGGYTEIDSKLDFDGTLQYTITRHKRSNADTELVTRDDFSYTPQDRLLSQIHTITGQTPQLMSENTYNSIGQLRSKKVGNTSSVPLQKVDYAYTIRGWLKEINNVDDLQPATDPFAILPQDLFAFKINYNITIQQNISSSVVPLYNGNIAETSWRTPSDNIQRRYGYTYDKLNRLTDAWYQMPNATVPVRYSYDEHLTYDVNGNITSLQRNGELDSATDVTEIDNLSYTYSRSAGNRLDNISDDSMRPEGFKDGINTTNDYGYDLYGNMIADQNKGVLSITYNHMNLPVSIRIDNGTDVDIISYLYNAAGVKLKKTVAITSPSPSTTVTDYLGGYQYKNTLLEFFPTSEGYVKNTIVSGANNYSYVFQYKDHVGNNRISYMKDPADGVLKILEEDHYYPFGLKHNGYSANQQIVALCFRCPPETPAVVIMPVINPADATYKYMYNGKELQDELGLNMYDFGARNYDPAIGRWMNIDPLAEQGRRWTPYAYAFNNPVYFIDPDGMQAEDHITINHLTKEAHFRRTTDHNDFVTVTGSYGTTDGWTHKGMFDADEFRGQGYTVTEDAPYAVGSAVSDWALVAFGGIGGKLLGLGNLFSRGEKTFTAAEETAIAAEETAVAVEETVEAGSSFTKEDGKIYRVDGNKTSSGKPYIGRTKQSSPAQRGRGAGDGRDRTDAEIIEKYDSSKPGAGSYKEQKAIDKAGGVKNLDNKRNEVNPNRMKDLENKYGTGG